MKIIHTYSLIILIDSKRIRKILSRVFLLIFHTFFRDFSQFYSDSLKISSLVSGGREGRIYIQNETFFLVPDMIVRDSFRFSPFLFLSQPFLDFVSLSVGFLSFHRISEVSGWNREIDNCNYFPNSYIFRIILFEILWDSLRFFEILWDSFGSRCRIFGCYLTKL